MLAAEIESYRKSIQNRSKEFLINAAVDNYRQYGELSARLKETEKSSHEMFLMYADTKARLDAAKKEIALLREQNTHLAGVQAFQNQEMYGRSSEKTKGIISDIANEIHNTDPINEDADPINSDAPSYHQTSDNKSKISDINEYLETNVEKKKKQRKHDKDLSTLPKCICYEYDIDMLNEKYGEGNWRFSFWEEHRTIEIQKQYSYLKITYTPSISVGLAHYMEAIPYEGRIIPKSLFSSSLLAMITEDLYGMHLPLYRQEHDIDRFGITISRQTMSNCVTYAGINYLFPVYEYLCSFLKSFPYQQCDETTYTVILEQDHSVNYIWIHRTSERAETNPIIIYCYEPSRSAEHLYSFYEGISEHIYLTSDAYGAYGSLETHFSGMITSCGCFAHMRRRFVDALRSLTNHISVEELLDHPAVHAVSIIQKIYNEEEKLTELTANERLNDRLCNIKPLYLSLSEYIHSLDENTPEYSEKLIDAIRYFKNNEKQLGRFLEDGNIPLDNNGCEREVKPIACHRNNSLFSYSEKGAKTTVVTMSLIETAKANGAIPYYYLKYLFERMSKHVLYNHPCDYDTLLPWSMEYKTYEKAERALLSQMGAPPGNECPKTPHKKTA